MSAAATMPYFIRPSVKMNTEEKREAYATARQFILATLGNEPDRVVKMVTINSLLKTYLPYYYWVGFYTVRGKNQLVVGPYQGTLGCLYTDFSRGVCGKAAASRETQIVADTHALEQGTEHIACDPNSLSEIVVPVFDSAGNLFAVFDVDATLEGCFDEVDQAELESLMNIVFG